jgi:serine/threonine protein kinase
MQDYTGKQIDRYRITERIGMGGMAMVYKAYDTRLQRDVAIKLIRTGEIPESQHERLMKRFEREALSQARFMHRHIVPIYDYGMVDGAPYLVMGLISGGTLKTKMDEQVEWRQAVSWLIPIAEALGYAHQRGVIHRDVKPSNILFDDEGQPILTDFGIAKILEADDNTLTGTGLGVGTPEYMAPEQWQGKPCEATDQYALGVVLYELVTGQKPFTADTPTAIILMQATESLRAPSQLARGIPGALEKVLFKALAKNPNERYENMASFQKALRDLLESESGSSPNLLEKIHNALPSTRKQPSIHEEETIDVLETNPVAHKTQATLKYERESDPLKRKFPNLALWLEIALVVLIIIGVILVAILASN